MNDWTSPVDIRPDHLEIVQDILRTHLPAGFNVWVFGSRANWTTKDSSDLDLAVEGAGALDFKAMVRLEVALEESDLPYTVDVVDLNDVSPEFREIVEGQKVPLFWSGSQSSEGGWCDVTLGDLVEIKHGYAFKGTNIHDFPGGSSDVLLTPGNFTVGGGFKADKFKYYDGIVPDQFVLNKGDLVVTMTDLSKLSDTLGYPALVPECYEDRRYLHNQRLGKISLKGTGDVDTRYLYYVMCTAEYRDEVLASATGTTVKHTSPERIGRFTFKLPPLPEQRAIAHILGILDDKIELNRRMNQTLEEMARAIFQDWFVDFGPTRAKLEGREPYLPPELWALFPDRLVESELGEVPERWRVKTLGDCFNLTMGQSPPGNTYNDDGEGLPFFQGNADFGFRYPSNRRYCSAPAQLAQPGDTLVSVRAPVGAINMAWERCCIGRGVASLRHKSGSSSFTYYAAGALQQELQRYEQTGTVFGAITRKQFESLPTVEPNKRAVSLFDAHVLKLDEKIRENEASVRTLAAQRDVLLPKLVSGEVRVVDYF